MAGPRRFSSIPLAHMRIGEQETSPIPIHCCQTMKAAPASPPAPEPQENVPTPKEAPQAESPPAAFPEYDIPDMKQGGGLGMVEIEAVRDSGDEDDDSPPGR